MKIFAKFILETEFVCDFLFNTSVVVQFVGEIPSIVRNDPPLHCANAIL